MVRELDPDDQELLMAFSQAATELKEAYPGLRSESFGMPPYEELVRRT